MKTGENERAKKYLYRAAKIDVSNTLTLHYLHELDALENKDVNDNPEAQQQSSITNSIMPISSYKEDKPNIMAFVNLVIGVIIGIAVTAILIIPTVKKNITSDENSAYTDNASVSSQIEEKDNQISKLTSDNSDLKSQISQLQEKIDSAVTPDTSAYETLLSATQLYLEEMKKPERERDFMTVADTLAKISDSQINNNTSLSLLTQLREATYPDVAVKHYETGHVLYTNGKYDEALNEFSKALALDPKNVDAMYFNGRAYDRLGDTENAVKYYNQVINDFPDSSRVSEAKGKLQLIQ